MRLVLIFVHFQSQIRFWLPVMKVPDVVDWVLNTSQETGLGTPRTVLAVINVLSVISLYFIRLLL